MHIDDEVMARTAKASVILMAVYVNSGNVAEQNGIRLDAKLKG